MSSNPAVKKLVQVSEEAAPPIHVPVIVGNECYIIKQQDVRRIEDIRYLSYNKLCANGQLVPVDINAFCQQKINFIENVTTAAPQMGSGFATIEELIKQLHSNQTCPENIPTATFNCNKHTVEDIEGRHHIATVDQQLQWSKACNTIACPLTYSVSTSTSDLCPHSHICCQCTITRTCNQATEPANSCSRGINTMEIMVDEKSCGLCGKIVSEKPCKKFHEEKEN